MKRSRFTDEQIVRILQEADKDPVAEVAKRPGGERAIYLRIGIFHNHFQWREA